MCVHNILLNDLVQQLLVSEDYYAHWQAAAAEKMQTPQVSPTIQHHLSNYTYKYISAGIFACPIFCLKQSAASAHRSFSLRQRYPTPKSVADRKVSFESSLPNRPPASPAQASVSSPRPRWRGGRESAAGCEGATGETAAMRS